MVANGGILTHPDSGRAKLNLAVMSPALTYIDSRDGALLGRFRLPTEFRQSSIRHFALGAGDQVAIALQYQGPKGDLVPLVGLHRGRRPIALLPAAEPILRRMRHYCGGAAFDASGEILAVSCPRGNLVTFWQPSGQRLLDSLEIRDGCGVAGTGTPGRFMITGGAGDIYTYEPLTQRKTAIGSPRTVQRPWDNHLTAINSEIT